MSQTISRRGLEYILDEADREFLGNDYAELAVAWIRERVETYFKFQGEAERYREALEELGNL